MVMMEDDIGDKANDKNIGKSFIMVWGDNDVSLN